MSWLFASAAVVFKYVISHLKKTVTILSLLIHFAVLAKCQTTDLGLTSNSDTTFWHTHQQDKMAIFNLNRIENVKGDFVFRSWTPNSLLEIVKADNEIKGTITFFVINSVDEDSDEVFVREYQIPELKADLLYKLISDSEFNKIPSDKYIKNWEQGFDGITYLFEQRNERAYSFKHYWTPSSQPGLKEAESVQEFKEKLENVGGLSQYWEKFKAEIPFLSYKYFGASYSVQKIVTKKELRKYKREQKKKQLKENER